MKCDACERVEGVSQYRFYYGVVRENKGVVTKTTTHSVRGEQSAFLCARCVTSKGMDMVVVNVLLSLGCLVLGLGSLWFFPLIVRAFGPLVGFLAPIAALGGILTFAATANAVYPRGARLYEVGSRVAISIYRYRMEPGINAFWTPSEYMTRFRRR